MPITKRDKRLKPRTHWTLREVKQALSEIDEEDIVSDVGGSYPGIAWMSLSRAIVKLPQLRKAPYTVYNDVSGYERRLDSFISKYGPDALFPESGGDNQFTVEPTKESPNDAQLKPSKESSSSSPEDRDANRGDDRPLSNNPYYPAGESGEFGVGHRANQGKEEEGAFAKWDISLGGGNSGARPKAEPPCSPPQNNTYSASFKGDKVGFGPPSDALVSVSKGSANPGDRNGPLKDPEQSDKPGSIFRFSERTTPGKTLTKETRPKKLSSGVTRYDGISVSEPLGDVSSPLNSLSFGSFALFGAKGQRAWGLSNPSVKVRLSDLIGNSILSTGLDESWLRKDGAGFSREDKFRSGNPGGYIDEHKAELEKKSVRGQARKIARHFVGFFRDNEVGIGVEQTPRISGKRLVKELIGRSTRLSRSKREEKGTGLKLILVDISPSCEAIRDACFAAALAIADDDPNVVVIAHFNGYTGKHGGHIVGHRQKEIPHIWDTDDLEKFEAFLAKGKVSGAVCFGDTDAKSVYSLLSHYCPTVWMSPDDEEHCRYVIEAETAVRAYSEARLYIIGGVRNAQSAVEGLKKLKKGE